MTTSTLETAESLAHLLARFEAQAGFQIQNMLIVYKTTYVCYEASASDFYIVLPY